MAQHPSDHMSVVVRDNPRIEFLKQRREEKFKEEERKKAAARSSTIPTEKKKGKRPMSAGGRLTSAPMSLFSSFSSANSQSNPTTPGPSRPMSPHNPVPVPQTASHLGSFRSNTAPGFQGSDTGPTTASHERAFSRTLLFDQTFAKAGPEGLGLMGYLDPRIVDGTMLDRSDRVVVRYPKSLNIRYMY